MTDISELRVVLTVPDFDEALRFYRDSLGMTELEDWSTDNGRVVLLDSGRGTLELFDEAQAEYIDDEEVGRRVSGKVRLAIGVDDSDGMTEQATSGGGVLEAAPVDTPWGDRNARVRTPDGLQLTLFTLV